jgi:hypothetical protein
LCNLAAPHDKKADMPCLQFQTHQTPVRIAVGERAEFGTNEYFPYASTLEGIVSGMTSQARRISAQTLTVHFNGRLSSRRTICTKRPRTHNFTTQTMYHDEPIPASSIEHGTPLPFCCLCYTTGFASALESAFEPNLQLALEIVYNVNEFCLLSRSSPSNLRT